jgi:hypothetical protein
MQTNAKQYDGSEAGNFFFYKQHDFQQTSKDNQSK